MKQKLMFLLRVVVVAMLGVGSIPATAQTTANGPYYPWPAWDQTLACTALNACPRFVVLSNISSAAVLDRETGLVWERSPSTTVYVWQDASDQCITKTVGNRKGWRLPTIQELTSLIDPTAPPPGPTLPVGHPFQNVQMSNYWSASTYASDSRDAWIVQFGIGVSDGVKAIYKIAPLYVWCVRGHQGVDPQ
jgi:Protein of unknown function (DUF1566)